MVEDINSCGSFRQIQLNSIKEFPDLSFWTEFASFMHFKRLWENRETAINNAPVFGELLNSVISVMTLPTIRKKRIWKKALAGRDCRSLPVVALEADFVSYFDRLCKLGVKFSPLILNLLANFLIEKSKSRYTVQQWGLVHITNSILILSTYHRCKGSWIEILFCLADKVGNFKYPHKSNSLWTNGLLLSPESKKRDAIRSPKRGDIQNSDETYFVINVDNGGTLGFWGD